MTNVGWAGNFPRRLFGRHCLVFDCFQWEEKVKATELRGCNQVVSIATRLALRTFDLATKSILMLVLGTVLMWKWTIAESCVLCVCEL